MDNGVPTTIVILTTIATILFIIMFALGIIENGKGQMTEVDIYNMILQGEYKYISSEANYNPRTYHTNYRIIYEDEYGQIQCIEPTFEQYYKIIDKYENNKEEK